MTFAPLCLYISVIFLYYIKGRPKYHLRIGHYGREGGGGLRHSATLSLASVLDWDGWSAPLSVRFRPGNIPLPLVQEAGWAPGPVWTGAKNLAPARIRTPDRPGRDNSLSRPTLLLFFLISLQAWTGPEGSRRVRFSDFKPIGTGRW